MPRHRPGRLVPLALAAGAALLASAPRALAPVPDAAYGPEPAVSPTPVEADALEVLRSRLGAHARRPQVSSALILAARRLAEQAAAGEDPARRPALRNALARALAYDPAPMIYTVRTTDRAWREALSRALATGAATHVGAGAAEVGGGTLIVALASRRGVHLGPFPRSVTAGEVIALSGQLRSGLCNPRVLVSLPSGEVRAVPASGAVWFRANVPFEVPGRYVVEVLAEGPQGPTVAALLPVAAGAASFEAPAGPAQAGGSPSADGAPAVLEALAAARARRGLAPLEPDAALAEVARKHSEAMRAAAMVGHVLPGEPPLTARLARAGVRFRRVFENVAAAPTALAAHEAAEESPAHLKNLLEPRARRVGVGLAHDGAGRVYLTELLVE